MHHHPCCRRARLASRTPFPRSGAPLLPGAAGHSHASAARSRFLPGHFPCALRSLTQYKAACKRSPSAKTYPARYPHALTQVAGGAHLTSTRRRAGRADGESIFVVLTRRCSSVAIYRLRAQQAATVRMPSPPRLPFAHPFARRSPRHHAAEAAADRCVRCRRSLTRAERRARSRSSCPARKRRPAPSPRPFWSRRPACCCCRGARAAHCAAAPARRLAAARGGGRWPPRRRCLAGRHAAQGAACGGCSGARGGAAAFR